MHDTHYVIEQVKSLVISHKVTAYNIVIINNFI